tara:strand:- start:430 stop:987 length:558 start_codon:yes stop_codon:yes gene_type:complete
MPHLDVSRKIKMDIEFRRLGEVAKSNIVELMNNPLVREHLPLAPGGFDEIDCDHFIAAKEKLWTEHGYGPWAFVIDGQFCGWGGLQPENGEADFAMVLHPNYWGIGKRLFDTIIGLAFGKMGFEAVTALLPPTRKKIRALKKLGFEGDGELIIGGKRFFRYRLRKQTGANKTVVSTPLRAPRFTP